MNWRRTRGLCWKNKSNNKSKSDNRKNLWSRKRIIYGDFIPTSRRRLLDQKILFYMRDDGFLYSRGSGFEPVLFVRPIPTDRLDVVEW